jgi:serine protease Do
MKTVPAPKVLIWLHLLLFGGTQLASCAPAEKPEPAAPASAPSRAVNVAPIYANADDAINASRRNAITQAVEVCSPAVVGINVTEIREEVYRSPFSMFDDPFFERFFGGPTQRHRYQVKGVGSGFIISADGYILTNHHVAGTASKVVITMTDGSKHDAKVVGSDLVADVALLKIDANNLPYLKLANSDNVMVGEWSIAFGNPFGLFEVNAKPTVTVGVISNKGVSFTQTDESGEERVYRGMLQTDAAISSGNSGGPLVNSDGEVVGINTVIYSTAQSSRGAGSIGIGFAIPINRVKWVVDKIRERGKIDRNYWTGLKVAPLDEETAQYYRVDRTDGVLVTRVAGGSPADKAGIEPGDVIVAVGDEPVMDLEDLNVLLLDGEAGQKLKIKVDRGSSTREMEITLSKPPAR